MDFKDNFKFVFNESLSTGNENCQNILVHGDNKDVLPELWRTFGEKIKCIYIDPPYNNGESYHYYNDNIDGNAWLKEIRIVLTHLKQLLTRNGSLWISIDDSKMAYLKVEADKIFGQGNFVATVIWQQRKSRENRAVFSYNHEYVLVYASDIKAFKKSRNLLPVSIEYISSIYKNPDNDPRGAWQSVTANVQAGHAVASQYYTIVSPTGVRHSPPKGRCWIYNQQRMEREIAAGNIWFGKDGKSSPRVKKFFRDAKVGLTPETLWLADEVGTTDEAKKQIMTLFPGHNEIFETPKPEKLLKRIIEIASDAGDYVLDCYLGSGTTMATAHKLHRRYIGVEIGAQISELVVGRLKKVIDGDKTGISQWVGWKGGGEFAFYDYDKSCIAPTIAQKEKNTGCEKTKVTRYQQLNFLDVLMQYPDTIVENASVSEKKHKNNIDKYVSVVNSTKNVLISLIKDDNVDGYLHQSAKIYYTGKKFPSCVALNRLYYFMPYLKRRGIRDLYLIKIARIGSRKEGQPDSDPNDIRLVFEIEFVKHLFDDYRPVTLEIWHTFTDTTINVLLAGEET